VNIVNVFIYIPRGQDKGKLKETPLIKSLYQFPNLYTSNSRVSVNVRSPPVRKDYVHLPSFYLMTTLVANMVDLY
jgi:hypothetical protein